MLKDALVFFEKNISINQPILIGLSGGPDSLCLLHLLLFWNKAPIHIVHVDHGWRSESGDERQTLQNIAIDFNIPFHHTRLDPTKYTGNKEAQSRTERYNFFKKVANQVNAQGIVLGHQADDVSETVFKRVLEGACLTALSLQPVRIIDGLQVMRPLLTYTKKEILAWLNKKGIIYFSDPTNLQTKFLRGKLRTEIFPYLRQNFGKEFERSLCSISNEAYELKKYLDLQCQRFYEKSIKSPWGIYFPEFPVNPTEQKHILRSLPITLSREQVQLATKFLQENASNKELHTSQASMYFDRARVFYIPQKIPDVEGNIDVEKGSFTFGQWQITAQIVQDKDITKNSLGNIWEGSVSTYLPVGKYTICASNAKMRRTTGTSTTKEFGRYLNEKKIPNWLVSKVPVICQNNEIVEDFLTGSKTPISGPFLHISLKI